MTRRDLLGSAVATLHQAGVPSAEHDAEALLSHALGVPGHEIRILPEAPVAPEAAARFARLLGARAGRVPLQHLLGEIPFHAATLFVEPGVFIPRPETETLVECVLEELRHEAPPATILDLGTGTGAIPIALLVSLPPAWRAVALDRSERACALALRNARRNGVEERLTVLRTDFRDPPPRLPELPAGILASNLPYIPSGSIAELMPEVRDHDPREALDGGPDGLDAFRALARTLGLWLAPGGVLALEIGEDQADSLSELFGSHLAGVRIARDLAGLPRILTGRMRGTRA